MTCKKCGTFFGNSETRCPFCGEPVFSGTEGKDYTLQYDPRDIQENRVFAILSYLGILVVIPLLCARRSYYARFHANQGLVVLLAYCFYTLLKRLIVLILQVACGLFVFIPGAVSAVLSFIGMIFPVLAIIGIVNAVNGTAKPLPLLGRIRLLK